MFRGKLRIRFRKEGSLRFLGHHDLMRLWTRLLRRLGLPIKYGQGYHPRPRISCPLALSVGMVGLQEILEVELADEVSLDAVVPMLGDLGIEGLVVVSASLHEASDRTEIAEVEYAMPLPAGTDQRALKARRDETMAAPSIIVRRHHPRKPIRVVDIRPNLLEINISDYDVRFRIRVTSLGTVRPDEVLDLLGLRQQVAGALITRTHVRLADR
jgi:radical SAM-linked protein